MTPLLKVGVLVLYHSIYRGEYDAKPGPHPAEVVDVWDEKNVRLVVRPKDAPSFDVGIVAHVDAAGRDGRWWEPMPAKAQ